MHKDMSRPDDAGDDNKDTENLDAGADETDPVAYSRFEGRKVPISDVDLPAVELVPNSLL
jgi:hypothetical protein